MKLKGEVPQTAKQLSKEIGALEEIVFDAGLGGGNFMGK